MILLSVGMPKAGTGWLFNLQNDLFVAAGRSDVRRVRRRFHLHPLLKYANCNIGPLTVPRVLVIAALGILGLSFVVKTHAGPTPIVRLLLRVGLFRATYIYRDPRDAMLSAFDHGKQMRAAGMTNSFARLTSSEAGLAAVGRWLRVWSAWARTPGVLVMRYEDFKTDPQRHLQAVAELCLISVGRDEIEQLTGGYSTTPKPSVIQEPAGTQRVVLSSDRLHFNKGMSGRFRSEMPVPLVAEFDRRFRRELSRMGYAT